MPAINRNIAGFRSFKDKLSILTKPIAQFCLLASFKDERGDRAASKKAVQVSSRSHFFLTRLQMSVCYSHANQ